jgi:hypothetical protein
MSKVTGIALQNVYPFADYALTFLSSSAPLLVMPVGVTPVFLTNIVFWALKSSDGEHAPRLPQNDPSIVSKVIVAGKGWSASVVTEPNSKFSTVRHITKGPLPPAVTYEPAVPPRDWGHVSGDWRRVNELRSIRERVLNTLCPTYGGYYVGLRDIECADGGPPEVQAALVRKPAAVQVDDPNFLDWAILSPHLKDSVYLAHRLAVRYMNWNSHGRPGGCMAVLTYRGSLNPKTIAKALCPDRPPSVQVIHFAEEEGTQPALKVTPQHLPLRKVT